MSAPTPSRDARGVVAIAALLLVAALGFWPFLGSLGYDPMALDSAYWIVRSAVGNEGWAAWTFGGPHFIAYRPVAALSFSLTSLLVGLDPLAYRVFDLLLHAANGAGVYAVARRLAPSARPWVGVLAAAIFLVHPAAEEVVPWLARRHNGLACLFSLLSIRALLGALARPRGALPGLGAAVWLAAALLSNEVAYTTLAALPLLALAVGPRRERGRLLRTLAPSFAVAAAALALRFAMIGGVGGYTPKDASVARGLAVFGAFWRDLLCFDVGLVPLSLAALWVMVVLFAVATARSRRNTRLLFALILWLGSASLLLALQQVWFPRELYALLPAWALLLAFGLDEAVTLWRSGPAGIVAVATTSIWLSLLCAGGVAPQPERVVAWRIMQGRLDTLRIDLDRLDAPAEVLMATHYHERLAEARANPLRARPPRPGPPRSERIPAVWLSALHADREIVVRDVVAFPERGEPVRFERIDGRPALLFAPEQPFFVTAPLDREPHGDGVALWLDGYPVSDGRSRWLHLSGIAGLIPLSPRVAATPPEGPPLNILLIVVDTLRRDHLGAYGYARDTSPHLDRLAAEGVRYERALSQAPWTTPSVASLLTSRQPTDLGITDVQSKLGEGALLVSELLHDRGFTTGAVVSHRFCSERWGFDQGFDSFDDDNALDHQAVTSPSISDKALAFLERHGDERFFLWLHYFDPHFAYREHAGFDFPAEEPYTGPAQPETRFGDLLKLQPELSAADAAELMRRYDSEIRFTDHHIGRVLDHLRERGLLDRTLVVLTADHGEEFLDHGRLGHTKTLYEEVVGVPLIVRRPGTQPRVVRTPVALIDVVPTILAAAQVDAPDSLEGRPLGARGAQGAAFSATERRQPKRALVVGRDKLIHDVSAGRYERFDLHADPGEQHPLEAVDGPLREWLDAFSQRVLDAAGQAPSLDLSPEEEERLELLGYGEGAD